MTGHFQLKMTINMLNKYSHFILSPLAKLLALCKFFRKKNRVLQSNVAELKNKCYSLMWLNPRSNYTLQCGTPVYMSLFK